MRKRDTAAPARKNREKSTSYLTKEFAWFNVPTDWYVPSREDAPRMEKFLQGHRLVRPRSMRRGWQSLSKEKKRFVIALGIGGPLAKLLNTGKPLPPQNPKVQEYVRRRGQHPSLITLVEVAELTAPILQGTILGMHKIAGWPGVMALLAQVKANHDALMDAALFMRWGFVPQRCPHGGHWYFRHTVGRKPEACPLHATAARQARWRKSPSRA
jgi:hypothetical protein